MIQLGPEIAEIEFAVSIGNGGTRYLSNAEVTVLPCGLVHVRPEHMSLGYHEFTVPTSAVKEIRWNPFGRVIDYGPKTVASEVESPVVEAIHSVGKDLEAAIDYARKDISGHWG